MYEWISYDQLYHHGILGQKWGKRNGPPYPLSAERHSSSEKKAGWRKSLSEKRKSLSEKWKETEREYKEQRLKDLNSMSATEYRFMYDASQKRDRKKIEKFGEFSRWDSLTDKQKKILITTGLVAAAGVTAAVLYRNYGSLYMDNVIKSGTTLQTLSFDPDRVKLGQHFYASYLSSDKATYIGEFSKRGGKFKNKILTETLKDIKVASPKTIEKELRTYVEANQSNPNIYKDMHTFFKNEMFGPNIPDIALFKDHTEIKVNDWSTASKQFITNLNFQYEGFEDFNPESQPFLRAFYKHLSDKGYSAIKDYNDLGWANSPVIIFDRAKIGESVVKEISNKEYNIAVAKALGNEFVQILSSNPKAAVLYGTTAVVGGGTVGASEYNAYKNKNDK